MGEETIKTLKKKGEVVGANNYDEDRKHQRERERETWICSVAVVWVCGLFNLLIYLYYL